MGDLKQALKYVCHAERGGRQAGRQAGRQKTAQQAGCAGDRMWSHRIQIACLECGLQSADQ